MRLVYLSVALLICATFASRAGAQSITVTGGAGANSKGVSVSGTTDVNKKFGNVYAWVYVSGGQMAKVGTYIVVGLDGKYSTPNMYAPGTYAAGATLSIHVEASNGTKYATDTTAKSKSP